MNRGQGEKGAQSSLLHQKERCRAHPSHESQVQPPESGWPLQSPDIPSFSRWGPGDPILLHEGYRHFWGIYWITPWSRIILPIQYIRLRSVTHQSSTHNWVAVFGQSLNLPTPKARAHDPLYPLSLQYYQGISVTCKQGPRELLLLSFFFFCTSYSLLPVVALELVLTS